VAQVGLNLICEFTPAYDALVVVAHEIAAQFGEDAALDWAGKVLREDNGLFVRMRVDRRPKLRVLRGGKE
jgi:hypothetical protein